MPEVSFVVPVYNAARYLPQCLQSLLGQTNPDFEIILVDDGSTDGSPALCDAAAVQDARVRVVHQKNAGVSTARNAGMALARGVWLSFVDADDWLDETFAALVAQYGPMAGDLLLFNYADVWPGRTAPHQTPGGPVALGTAALAELRQCTLNRYHHGPVDTMAVHITGPCMKAYRRAAVQGAKLAFPVGITAGEDAYFNFLFLAGARGALFVPRVVYYYRRNAASTTQRYQPALEQNYRRLIALYTAWFAANGGVGAFAENWQLYQASCCLFAALRGPCHPAAPGPWRVRRAALAELCGRAPFKDALRRADLRRVSRGKAAALWLLRHRCFAALALASAAQCRASGPNAQNRRAANQTGGML